MAGKPNILFILVDQMRMPPDQANLTPALRQLNQVLSFDPELEPDNPFLPFLSPTTPSCRSFPPSGGCVATLSAWPTITSRLRPVSPAEPACSPDSIRAAIW
jgi:hypothetical protein